MIRLARDAPRDCPELPVGHSVAAGVRASGAMTGFFVPELAGTLLSIPPTALPKIRESIHQGATASYPSPNLRLVVVVSLTELVPHHPFFWNNLEAVGEEDEGDRPNQCPRCGETHGPADEHCGEPDVHGISAETKNAAGDECRSAFEVHWVDGRLVPPEHPGSLNGHQGSEGKSDTANGESHVASDLKGWSKPSNHCHRRPDQNHNQWRRNPVLQRVSRFLCRWVCRIHG